MASSDTLEEMRERCVCLNLRRVTRLMTRLFDEAYASTGLRSTQAPILFFLLLDGETPMGMLAEKLAMDKSTLSRNFKLLEARGLVTRSSIDGRTIGASITSAGRKALQPVYGRWKTIQDDMVKNVGRESWLETLGVLRKMTSLQAPDGTAGKSAGRAGSAGQ